MDEDLKAAMEELENLHAVVWMHFDPTARLGDKKQPKDIKKALAEVRKFCRKHGKVFDGWQR